MDEILAKSKLHPKVIYMLSRKAKTKFGCRDCGPVVSSQYRCRKLRMDWECCNDSIRFWKVGMVW